MSNIKISQLPTGTVSRNAVVPATNADGNTTEKVTCGSIADLAKSPVVVTLGFGSTINTNAAEGDILNVTLTAAATLANPTNPSNGKTLRWRITQDGTGGRSVTLGSKFAIPSSATSPLPWSTAANKTDLLAATYDAGRDKWDIIAFVPGY
jgi:hypothetical protein